MSFDIFVQAFEDGEPRTYSRAVLKKAFGSFCDTSDPTWWKVADSLAGIQLADEPEVDNFSVNRPPADDHPFWPALLQVMRETSSVLYWPGSVPVITDKSVEASLPPDMVESLGPVRVVTSVAEIFRLLDES